MTVPVFGNFSALFWRPCSTSRFFAEWWNRPGRRVLTPMVRVNPLAGESERQS
jgi:hypothetical protein